MRNVILSGQVCEPSDSLRISRRGLDKTAVAVCETPGHGRSLCWDFWGAIAPVVRIGEALKMFVFCRSYGILVGLFLLWTRSYVFIAFKHVSRSCVYAPVLYYDVIQMKTKIKIKNCIFSHIFRWGSAVASSRCMDMTSISRDETVESAEKTECR